MKSLNKTETLIFLSVVYSLFPKAIFLCLFDEICQRTHNFETTSIQRSCIKAYEHSCSKLFLNGPEAVFKQQNPCSNHKIHVLFEHGFLTFDITRWALLCLHYIERRNVIALNVGSILEFYDDVRGSMRNWRHCKQHTELAAMLVCRRVWRGYMEFIWSFGAFSS